MKLKIGFLLLISFFSMATVTTEVYLALKSDSKELIESTIKKIEVDQKNIKNKAYKGALLMKKASFEKSVAQKIEVFKSGKELLEFCIKEQPQNTEFRFLRLTIQENSPKILKYNTNLTEDKNHLVSEFKKSSVDLQKHIREYATSSKILTLSELEK